jgi:hypothetical protein
MVAVAPQEFDAYSAHRVWTQIQAEAMKRDLLNFIEQAWHIVEPGKEFKGGWHIDAICEHLTYVSLGDIDDLIINIRSGRGIHQYSGCSLHMQAPSRCEIR